MTTPGEPGGPLLPGRVALVTGASRGLGAAIAERLAAEGAAVAVTARTADPLPDGLPGSLLETAEAIRRAGGVAAAFTCDVSREEELEALVTAVTGELGAPDVLVNNAALTIPGDPSRARLGARAFSGAPSFLDFPLRAYRKAFEVNLFSVYRLCQLALPGMLAQGRGSIVNISSGASVMPGPAPWPADMPLMAPAYGSSKAALEHLTFSLAHELAPAGIAVNALSPSVPVRSPGLVFAMPGETGEAPHHFARAAALLAAATPDTITGTLYYHHDLLSGRPPEGMKRGAQPLPD